LRGITAADKKRGLTQKLIISLHLLFFVLLLPVNTLFAKGKSDETAVEGQNKEWVLCVTAFDVDALPAEKRIIGEVITRDLVQSVNSIEQHIRISPEYAWYEDYAWTQSRGKTAQALAAKQEERSALLYRGDPRWKYKRDLKTINKEIEKLKEDLAKADSEKPEIVSEPVFQFTEGNKGGTFLPPPKAGAEYYFCQEQKADAVLSGAISEYHGRIFIVLKLYAKFSDSWVYDDNIIFSSDDANEATDEISRRLISAVSGKGPAVIAVNASPDNAMILVNNAIAGTGQTGDIDHISGGVTVRVSAENYYPQTLETVLVSGDRTEINFNLRPMQMTSARIALPAEHEVSVYRGALYAGQAPLTLRLPVNQLEYVYTETLDKRTSSLALIVDKTSPSSGNFYLKVKPPYDPAEQQVEKARRQYYGAWGRFWVAVPAAFVLYGVLSSYVSSYNYSANIHRTSGQYNEDDLRHLYDQANLWQKISAGAIVVAGLVSAEVIIQTFRYLSIADKDTIVIREGSR
jgi:hypothetical protein